MQQMETLKSQIHYLEQQNQSATSFEVRSDATPLIEIEIIENEDEEEDECGDEEDNDDLHQLQIYDQAYSYDF